MNVQSAPIFGAQQIKYVMHKVSILIGVSAARTLLVSRTLSPALTENVAPEAE